MISSVGYEGRSVGDLVGALTSAGVAVLVDVRLNPWSRKPGFSKKALALSLEAAGISYVHEPSLGNPRSNRAAFQVGDGAEGRRRLRALLEGGDGRAAIARLVALARERHVGVLCLERDASRCHRQMVTDLVLEMAPDLLIEEIP